MKHFRPMKLLVACMAFLLVSCSAATDKELKVLLVTGQNNHNWQVSHLALQQIMENTGKYTVDFAISPGAGQDMSGFVLDFQPYDLVLLDYNGDAWPETTNQRFLEYVKMGGGVVVYHAADNAFAGWKEYNEICALGGWEGRNEQSGPYVYWEDGKLVKDNSPGSGGSHGSQHEYVMNRRDNTHPIVKGLPEHWMHAQDELYDRMRGPGDIKTLLYTAFSEKATGGSGREEPLLFTIEWGKGRIFHTMLGHAGPTIDKSPAMQCVGFQETLLRGAEWAATGKVTRPVSADFPTAEKTSFRLDYKAGE